MSRGDRASNSSCLELQALTCGYHGKSVLSDVSLALPAGQVLALVGPNGAGKSTLLRTIAGQLPALGGHILLDGDPLDSLTSAQRARVLAALFTDRRMPSLITCREVVEMGRYPFTGRMGLLTSHDRAVADEALELVGAQDLAARQFSQLSDGQRQRVLLARALCQEPRVLLLDEPAAYLDVRYSAELMDLVRDLCASRRIAVAASMHELHLVLRMADTVLCLRDHHVQAIGAPEDVLDEPGVAELFDLRGPAFDPLLGTVELARPQGNPQVFVVIGGSFGTAAMRSLRRAGVPFACGIAVAGEVDAIVARHLATRSIETSGNAKADLERCREIIVNCQMVLLPARSDSSPTCASELLHLASDLGKPVVRTAEEVLALRGR